MKALFTALALVPLVACGAGKASQEEPGPSAPAARPEGAALTVPVEKQRAWGIEVAPVARIAATTSLTLPGVLALDQTRSAQISPRVEGQVVKVLTDLGQPVRAGQVLLVVHSPAFAQAQTAFLQADARRTLARKEFERAGELLKQEAIQEKEYLRRQAEYDAATTDYALQESTMHSLGLDHPQLRALVERARAATGDLSDLAAPQMQVVSPIDGRVIFRDVMIGQHVAPDTVLFTVSDLRTVWALLDAREKDLPALVASDTVTVRAAVYPDRRFEGRNVRVGDVVDEKLRTIKVRVEVANPGFLLKPNMYVQGVIDTGGARREVLAVPEEAVQTIDGEPTVFVLTQPETFAACPVEIGERLGASREIVRGLQGSERIAVRGAFNLKSELMKSSLGGE